MVTRDATPPMTEATPLPAEACPPIPAGGLVVAVTDDGTDPRYAAVRDAAAGLAASIHGKVLLFYARQRSSTGPSVRPRFFFPTTPTRRAQATRAHTGSRRRDLLGAEAAAIRAHGVGVAVWLAGQAGPAALAEAVALTHASAVLLPAEPSRPGVIRRTLDYHAAKIAAPVVAVHPDGRLETIRPLGGSRPAIDLGPAPAFDVMRIGSADSAALPDGASAAT